MYPYGDTLSREEVCRMANDDVDITGWSEDEIQAWEIEHEQFATDERANAAPDAAEKELREEHPEWFIDA